MRDIDELCTRILNERGPGQLQPRKLTTASGRTMNMLMMDIEKVIKAMVEDPTSAHLLDFRARRVRRSREPSASLLASCYSCCLWLIESLPQSSRSHRA